MPDTADLAAQLLHAQTDAIVIDLSDRAQFEIAGNDRHSFLHNFCTHDIKALRIGAGCEAFLCNIKGRILGHVFVFAGESSIWIETFPGQGAPLLAHLRRYHLVEDLKFQDRTESHGELLVVGQRAVEIVAQLDESFPLHDWNHRQTQLAQVGGNPVWIKRADVLGLPCCWLSTQRDLIPQLQASLIAAGATTASQATFETLRIEAALPCYGTDLTDENLAQEANRTRQAISFSKGCYLGQEPIARLHAMGHVNKELKRFEIDAASPPPVGTTLLNPEDSAKEIGRVTSCAWSPARTRYVGLGIVRSAFSSTGTTLPLSGNAGFAKML